MQIDWQKVCLNLRRHRSLWRIAREIGADGDHLNRLARGEVQQPRFNTGIKLLDLHEKYCRDRHSLEYIGI
jgi:hypothetical protein